MPKMYNVQGMKTWSQTLTIFQISRSTGQYSSAAKIEGRWICYLTLPKFLTNLSMISDNNLQIVIIVTLITRAKMCLLFILQKLIPLQTSLWTTSLQIYSTFHNLHTNYYVLPKSGVENPWLWTQIWLSRLPAKASCGQLTWRSPMKVFWNLLYFSLYSCGGTSLSEQLYTAMPTSLLCISDYIA